MEEIGLFKNVSIIVLALGVSPSIAQVAPPQPASIASRFAPIIIDEKTYNDILTYLSDQPLKFSAPIYNELANMELSAARAANAGAGSSPKLPPPPR